MRRSLWHVSIEKRRVHYSWGCLGCILLLAAFAPISHAQVVINEIHPNPDLKNEPVEFVELHNAGYQAVDLGGWTLREGIDYRFAPGTMLPAGGYVAVAQDPAAVVRKFGVSSALVFGPFAGKLSNEGETLELCDSAGGKADEVTYGVGFPWPTVGDPIPATLPGTARSMQLVNPALDNDLGGSWRSAPPTPCAANAVFAANIPPQVRQVKHLPGQPAPGDVVTISAKVTDPDGVAAVTLLYQVVDPGAYIALADAAYQTNWTEVAMNDAGQNGDSLAGDSIFAVQLPASLQANRRLIRYRIRVADNGNRTLTVPYPDDPQPNFAYFVYGGAPPFIASKQPGVAAEEVFTTRTMNCLPIYHLITKKSETEKCTWLDHDMTNMFRYHGTLVYDGKVYDHIAFRARGGTWRFAMRKNMWKFEMNRGHEFEARDNFGNKRKVKWNQVNLGACIQQGNYLHRGEQGMFEAAGFALFNLAGLEASRTNFVHFRIIDETNEDGRLNAAHPPLTVSGTQYDGDFWGLYLAVEEVNGRFLDSHELPDGNLYKMENWAGMLKNQGPTGVTDGSDVKAFMNGYNARPASPWWRANVDLARYFNYRSMIEAIHHYDNGYGKNYFYYLNPDTAHWTAIPWDLDLTWANNMYGNGNEPFKANGLLDQPDLQIEYQNRLRELRDLLYNSDQTGQLIDETASFIHTPGQQSFVDADRAMWDYHWVMTDAAYSAGYADKNGKAGQGGFYKIAPTRDFAGMLKLMKDYVVSRGAWIDTNLLNDPAIPQTPSVTADCPPTYPADALRFRTSIYSSPAGVPFAALQWRIAEVETFTTAPIHYTRPCKYEINPAWQSGEIGTFSFTADIPTTAVQTGHTYRVRARMKDGAGRWSHWSAPLQFTAGVPLAISTVPDYLRISEVMYHPLEDASGTTYTEDDFEFIEVRNIGPKALDLTGVTLTDGVQGSIVPESTLQPGECAVIIKNTAAFRKRYGSGPRIIGQFTGKLSNGGELLRLADASGATVTAFEYSDGRGWPQAADGGGHSLVPLVWARDPKDGPLDYGRAWRASTYLNGSPGLDDPTPPASVMINEFLANAADANDWIEIINPTASPITLDHYYLSDDVAVPRKWKIPTQVIQPGSRLAFDALTGFNANPLTGFALSQYGEQVVLSYLPGTSQDRIVDAVPFKAQEKGVSLGRYPDGNADWFFAQTPGRGQASRMPLPRVVINEIMYHPGNPSPTTGETTAEYIEIHNPFSTQVNLWNATGAWRLSGGIDYQFPAGAALAPGACALVVGFDPANATLLNDFLARYGLIKGAVTVWGPYTGSLSNRCDRICLEEPKAPELPGDPLAWVIVDEAIYVDQYPFTPDADGSGKSLHRIDRRNHGWDPANWNANAPSPGAPRGVLFTHTQKTWTRYQ